MLQSLKDRIGDTLVDKFQNTTVAICGLGGLGSNVAIALSRAGIGKLILVDYDKVDISNLNRQQYKLNQLGMSKTEAIKQNLQEITQITEFEIYNKKLDNTNYSDVLKNADIICEAFDNADEKSSLVNYVLENMLNKYIVSASGMANLDSPNKIITKKITDKFYVCGDFENSTDNGGTLYAPRVMLCASHQATTILQIIAEKI